MPGDLAHSDPAHAGIDHAKRMETNLVHQQNVRARELGIVVIDVHPIVSDHLKRHMGKVNSALSLAAEEHGTVVVRVDGISLRFP